MTLKKLTEYWLWPLVWALAFTLLVLHVVRSFEDIKTDQPERHCSTYRDTNAINLPARCINYWKNYGE